MRFQLTVDKEKLARRAAMLKVQEDARPDKEDNGPEGKSIAFGGEDAHPSIIHE